MIDKLYQLQGNVSILCFITAVKLAVYTMAKKLDQEITPTTDGWLITKGKIICG